ncbi:DUF4190 domain-containing protein [Bifidobacterium saguinibicoloris]|uniref:DUF4190 domain-containing protein n=1 Tax=Bifidobacterium saguinibicoloris TaxID=2834433 RepID=UPI001C589A9F|nr:DUF4190 domain-containing protein [Bifidobacterium saguinibicoloris]MBW3080750.1 hypothetical protein [Bifidobacterium saguinibicoloris]
MTQQQTQPRYGQYAHLDYGAMRSQFGPNYNPYLYGAPDPDDKGDDAASAPSHAGGNAGVGANTPNAYPAPQGPAYPAPGAPGASGRAGDGRGNRRFYGIDVDDPNQNPLYGRWDSYAILAFVFAVIFSVPVMPAIMGCISLWRTKTFHMKGRGLAIAAIVVNVLTTILWVWMTVNGIDVSDLTRQLLNMYGLDSGGSAGSGSGDSSGSMSA